jgi:hypothetical protein
MNNTYEKGYGPTPRFNNGRINNRSPEITGNTDGNVFLGDIPTFKKYGYKKPAEPTPNPVAGSRTIKKGNRTA